MNTELGVVVTGTSTMDSRSVVRWAAAEAHARHAEPRLVTARPAAAPGFRDLVLGSTSQQLLHHATCPVAVVRTEVTE